MRLHRAALFALMPVALLACSKEAVEDTADEAETVAGQGAEADSPPPSSFPPPVTGWADEDDLVDSASGDSSDNHESADSAEGLR